MYKLDFTLQKRIQIL